MSFKYCEEVKFELTDAFTWGVEKNKYDDFSIPLATDDETKTKIEDLVKKYDTKNPLYEKTLYLKAKAQSDKQKKEL